MSAVACIATVLTLPAAAKPPGGGPPPNLPHWVAVPLDPTPGDGNDMYIYDMNDRGDICGYFSASGWFIFSHDGSGGGDFIAPQSLVDPADNVIVDEVTALNNVGQFLFVGSRNGSAGILRWNPPSSAQTYGTVTTVVDQGAYWSYGGLCVNDAGDVIGRDDLPEPFLYLDGNGLERLDVAVNWFTGFNNAGQASGRTFDGLSHAIRYTVGVGLQTLSSRDSRALDINAGGDITGTVYRTSWEPRAFLFTDSAGFVELPTLGGNNSSGAGINADRYIVGVSSTSSKRGAPSKPFIYHASFGTIDLTKQIDNLSSFPAGTTFGFSFVEFPKCITDSRHILINTNTVGPCLLVPVP